MKYLTGLIIAGLITVNVYAKTYTYKVVEDKIEITSKETTVTESSQEYTIEDLEAKIATLEVSKKNTLEYFNTNTARLEAEIVVIKEQIEEAGKMGISKKVIEVK